MKVYQNLFHMMTNSIILYNTIISKSHSLDIRSKSEIEMAMAVVGLT
jgi:hypothetical protein